MSKSKVSIDLDQIEVPQVELSQQAGWQIANMLENDPYLENKFLRLTIDGKGCDGFTYAIGFTRENENDFDVELRITPYRHPEDDVIAKEKKQEITTKVLFDPFAAYYLSNVKIDYTFDTEQDCDGFVVTNLNQESFHGKFWRKKDSNTPPELETQRI
jgi:iron-sulfur cluster insertion protein